MLLILTVGHSSHLVAKPVDSKTSPLPYGERITLSSKALAKEHDIDIYLPSGYETDSEQVSYPVIYTLDGWTLSQGISGVVGHLGNTAGMPKAIVVALHTDNIWRYLPKTHTHDSGWNLGRSPNDIAPYMQFISDELIPYVESNYRANDFRVLIGMSPTAILALHTFLEEPELFDAHFLFAAVDIFSLGFSEHSNLADSLIMHLQQNPKRKGHLYIASAVSDTKDEPKYHQNLERLNKEIKPYISDSFKFKAELIAEFDHYPMAIPGLLSAINFTFPSEELQQFLPLMEKPGNALENIDKHYQMLSAKFGFKISPAPDLHRNGSCLRSVGYRLLGQERSDEAVDIFNRWTELSPKEANAFDSLADALESDNKLKLAIQARQQAVNLAKQQNDPRLALFERGLAASKAKL